MKKKIKLSLKYQILIKGTSLFAEVELNGKISESMKSRSLGKKDAKNPPNTLQPLNNNNIQVLIANGPFDQNIIPYEISIKLNQQSPTSVPDDLFGGPSFTEFSSNREWTILPEFKFLQYPNKFKSTKSNVGFRRPFWWSYIFSSICPWTI